MNNTRKLIKEELTKTEVKDIVNDKLKSREVENIIKKAVEEEIKGNKELEKEVMTMTKNALTQFVKTLWVRRDNWISGIKNKSN